MIKKSNKNTKHQTPNVKLLKQNMNSLQQNQRMKDKKVAS